MVARVGGAPRRALIALKTRGNDPGSGRSALIRKYPSGEQTPSLKLREASTTLKFWDANLEAMAEPSRGPAPSMRTMGCGAIFAIKIERRRRNSVLGWAE